MESIKTTVRLIAMVAFAAAALFITDVRLRLRREAGQSRDLPRGLSGASSIEVVFSNGMKRVFTRDEKAWRIVDPVPAPAEDSQVQLLLDAIEGSTRLHRISRREMSLRSLSMADFGLDPAAATVSITGRHGFLRTISLGGTPPASTNEIFASIDREDGVSVLDTRIMDVLSRPIEDFSDRRLFRVALLDVNRITVERPGAEPMRLRRAPEGDTWRMSSPDSLSVDWGEMQKFLDAIAQARVDAFLYGPPPVRESDAAFTLKLYSGKAAFPVVVSIGRQLPDGTVPALADGGGAVAISAETAAALDITPAALRDKRVFASGLTLDIASIAISGAGGGGLTLEREPDGDWTLSAPVAAKADQDTVSRLIGEILALQADSYAQPATNGIPVVAEIATSGATNRLECVFTPEGGLSVVLDDADTAALAGANALETLLAVASRPGIAVSRHIGGLQMRDILAVDITRADGSGQRFDLAPDGSMSIGGDDAGTEPISDAEEISSRISAIARFLASIDAEDVLPGILPPDGGLAALGLDPPFLSVAIEPRNPSDGIVSVAFSAPGGGDGDRVFARAGDSPAIYVFPAESCEIFARNFRESYHQAEPQAQPSTEPSP